MTNTANTTQGMRRKKANRKFSKTMAVILGLIVTCLLYTSDAADE